MAAYTDHRNTRVDSAEQVLRSNKKLTDKERMECYYQIVRGTLGKDTEKHNRYCHLMLALSYKIDAKNMRESALYHLGLQHYGQDDFAQAERYFKWALEVTDSMTTDKRYTEADIDDNRSQLYGALGNLYNLQDKALLAIDYYQKALPIFERHGWLQSQTILHHNVAELWLSMGNNRKAEQEYLRAIEAGEASGDSLMMALPRKGLVKIYIDEENYDKAKQTLQLCHNYYYAHRYEEPGDYPEVLASLVKMHLMKGHVNLPKARSYAKEALAWVSDDLMAETRFDVYAANAMVEMRQNRWHEALGFALQSVHENDEEATFTDVDSYEMLSQIYMQLGDK
ncbi:MAG: tetratricopeptide repeat protein, partial [Bacteroidales bacterium]|nr:tetratricopeptide repeat protein [Bacteroidales bacterium]